jgi:hypothetical protein
MYLYHIDGMAWGFYILIKFLIHVMKPVSLLHKMCPNAGLMHLNSNGKGNNR